MGDDSHATCQHLWEFIVHNVLELGGVQHASTHTHPLACTTQRHTAPTFNSRPRLLYAFPHDRSQCRQPRKVKLGVLPVVAALRHLEATVLHGQWCRVMKYCCAVREIFPVPTMCACHAIRLPIHHV
jgi:hypothetical protein